MSSTEVKMFLINSKRSRLVGLIIVLISVIIVTGCSGSLPGQDDLIDGIENPIYATEAIRSIIPYPIEKDRLDEPIEKLMPEDGNFLGVPVIIDSVQIVRMVDSPSGYGMRLMGTMPTPCHQLLYEFSEGDNDSEIQVEVFAIARPGENCIQIIEQFDETVPLEEFSPGVNRVWVNSIEAVEVDLQ